MPGAKPLTGHVVLLITTSPSLVNTPFRTSYVEVPCLSLLLPFVVIVASVYRTYLPSQVIFHEFNLI